MKKEKTRRLLSLLLACLLVLNVPMSALGEAEIQTADAEQMNVTQTPDTAVPEIQADEIQMPDEAAPEIQTPEGAELGTDTPDVQILDIEEMEPQTPSAETMPEAEQDEPRDKTFADVRFALTELPEDAAAEAYLPAVKDGQDGSYLVTLPFAEEPVETVYVKPELADPDCFAFMQVGDGAAVELADQEWTAVDVAGVSAGAELTVDAEIPAVLIVAAAEDPDAEDAVQYAVRFEQETEPEAEGTPGASEPGTEELTEAPETEGTSDASEPGTEELTEAPEAEGTPDASEPGTEELTEAPETEGTADASEPGTEELTEAPETEVQAESESEPETEVLPETGSESETGEFTDGTEKTDSLNLNGETEEELAEAIAEAEQTDGAAAGPVTLMISDSKMSAAHQEEYNAYTAAFDEASKTYVFKLPANAEGYFINYSYVQASWNDENIHVFVGSKAGSRATELTTGTWKQSTSHITQSMDLVKTTYEAILQVGTATAWAETPVAGESDHYQVRFESTEPLSARPTVIKSSADNFFIKYVLGDEADPLTIEATLDSGDASVLTYQWYKTDDTKEPPQESAIAGATGTSCIPKTDTIGSCYYHVIVTNEETGKRAVSVRKQVRIDISGSLKSELSAIRSGDNLTDPESLEVTLPWGKEALSTSAVLWVAGAGEVSAEWFISKKDVFDSAEAVTWEGEISLMNGFYTYEGREDRVSSKRYSMKLPATTVPGDYYIFARVTRTLGKSTETELRGPFRLTVKAPQTLAYGVIKDEEPIGVVSVSIEDSTPKQNNLTNQMGEVIEDIGPAGSFLSTVSVPLYPSDDMMKVIARTCLGYGITQEGAEKNYISKITGQIKDETVSRAEFDRGAGSGWMGTLDDWIANEGFQAYSVENKELKPGDAIKLMYTTDLGVDLGASVTEKELRLKSMTIQALDEIGKSNGDYMQPAFQDGLYEYDVNAGSNKRVKITAVAVSKQFRIRIFSGDQEYAPHSVIPVESGDVLRIVCCDPHWDPDGDSPENDALARIYTVNVSGSNRKEDNPLIANTNIYVTALTADGAVVTEALQTSGRNNISSGTDSWNKRKPPYKYFYATFGKNSTDPAKDPVRVKLVLEDVPENTTATIEPIYQPEQKQSFAWTNGELSVELEQAFTTAGTWDFRIRATDGERKSVEWLQLTKALRGLSSLNLDGNTPFGETELHGAPEGTLFQLDADGQETGQTGYDGSVSRYNLYVTPGIAAIGPKTATSLAPTSDVGAGAAVLYVDDEEVLRCESLKDLSSQWFANKDYAKFTGDEMRLHIQWTSAEDETDVLDYQIHVFRQAYDVADLEKLIDALPDAGTVEYARDYSTAAACQATYDNLSEEQKAEVAPEAAERLAAVMEALDRQKKTGDEKIAYLHGLVDTYRDAGIAESGMTEELFQKHWEKIRESWNLYNSLTGWAGEQFTELYPDDVSAITKIYGIANRYAILSGASNEKAVNYVDDFMVSSNAYNLTLGAPEDAYPVIFRDIMYSNGSNEGKPYNTPGRLKYTIEDESIVTIKEKQELYEDKGLGGGGKFDDMRYYLIPHKAGTTTLTVTLTDETGAYYGQIPKIIIHVNSPEEASVEDVADRLTDFNKLTYTTKYDTWHYREGTEGAPFTFHVYGQDPQVTVWPAGKTGEKIPYQVEDDGSVTVYLKDGYNPIEVTATLDNKRVTQVYGLRGKAVSISVENKYRAGEPFVQGDTAVIKIVGLNIPVHKILRIYNPWGGVIWTYRTEDLPGQGELRATKGAGQYGTGYLEVLLNNSGTVRLTDGHIEEDWIGSGLYSEGAQGNTGGIAGQSGDNNFSRLPDIELEVSETPGYEQQFRIHPQLEQDGFVKAGEAVTVTIPDLPLSEITDEFPFVTPSTTLKFQHAWTKFATNIPGLARVSSERAENPGINMPAEAGLAALKRLTFTVPADTPTGTYRLCGGYVDAKHGDAAFTINSTRMFEMQIEDIEFEVINPAPGAHTCDWDEGTVTKEATCTEDGIRTYTCTINSEETRTEAIPSRGGHSYDTGVVTKEAACTEDGVRTYTCTVCGQTKTEAIAATGSHTYDAGVVTKGATCTEDGVRTYTCTVCGDTKTEAIAATGGHTYDAGVVTKEATCTEDGVRTYTCTACKETKTEAIAATGSHDFTWKTTKKATVFEAEKQTGTCKVCGRTETRTSGTALKPTISVNASSIVLEVKQSTTALKVNGLARGDSVESWKSGNKKIFKVTNSGKITAGSKTGSAKLTITLASGKKKTVKVTVQKTEVKTKKISGLKKKLTVKKGKKAVLKPVLSPLTSEQKITYKSSNKKVAAVTAKGVIKAKKKGKATITVRSGSVEFKIKVTVK